MPSMTRREALKVALGVAVAVSCATVATAQRAAVKFTVDSNDLVRVETMTIDLHAHRLFIGTSGIASH